LHVRCIGTAVKALVCGDEGTIITSSD
jgi:hypothetical protein